MTVEEFASVIQNLKADIKKKYTYCGDVAWARERLSQLEELDSDPQHKAWVQETLREAWETLATFENHYEALKVLWEASGREAKIEILRDSAPLQDNKRQKNCLTQR